MIVGQKRDAGELLTRKARKLLFTRQYSKSTTNFANMNVVSLHHHGEILKNALFFR